MVPVSTRSMQRFLTEARWDDDAVIARVQEYLGPKLEHPLAVRVFDGSDFPKQGRKSVGVARQYCGRLGKVANCQAGVFLAYVSPLGRALVDKRLYLPESWTSDKTGARRRGFRNRGKATGRRVNWRRRCWSGPWSGIISRLSWVAGDDAFGMSPSKSYPSLFINRIRLIRVLSLKLFRSMLRTISPYAESSFLTSAGESKSIPA